MDFKLGCKAVQLYKSSLYKRSPHVLFDFENGTVNNQNSCFLKL